jgi:glycosyltransferase involved in cell wall biosynthesis
MTSHDGLPMAILEAMACGIPVVSTRIGGIPEAVRNGDTGFLLSRDVASLKVVVEGLLDHPGRLMTLSENTRRLFAARFDIAEIVQEYHQVYLRDYNS